MTKYVSIGRTTLPMLLILQLHAWIPIQANFYLQYFSGRKGQINYCWPSPAQSILVLDPVGTHGHIFVLSKTFTCVEVGPPLRRQGGGFMTTTGHYNLLNTV
jgi:hypothetical protein